MAFSQLLLSLREVQYVGSERTSLAEYVGLIVVSDAESSVRELDDGWKGWALTLRGGEVLIDCWGGTCTGGGRGGRLWLMEVVRPGGWLGFL